MCDMSYDPEYPKQGSHRDLDKLEIKKCEDAVQRTISVIHNFTNPFTINDKGRRYSLASEAPIPLEFKKDNLTSHDVGKTAKDNFNKSRLHRSELSFFDLVKKQKLRTMEFKETVKMTSTAGKVNEY